MTDETEVAVVETPVESIAEAPAESTAPDISEKLHTDTLELIHAFQQEGVDIVAYIKSKA